MQRYRRHFLNQKPGDHPSSLPVAALAVNLSIRRPLAEVLLVFSRATLPLAGRVVDARTRQAIGTKLNSHENFTPFRQGI